MKPGVVARVNAVLKKEGRVERVRRARGYFLMVGGNSDKLFESGIYGCGFDFEALLGAARDKIKEGDKR